MPIETTWLQPTGITRGQDHLATRAICEILYGQLLPGVTNVTDRGRYYTLYPWVLWAMDQAEVAKADRGSWFRRADCLLTLISLHQGSDENTRAAVGSSTLSKALELAKKDGGLINLGRWAAQDAADGERYFKATRGGLGQYYQGTLERLGILTVNDAADGLTWTNQSGRELAEAVDRVADRARFIRCVDTGTVALDDLDQLASLRLAGLEAATDERDALTQVLWSVTANRRSMRLILDLAHQLSGDDSLNISVFRGSTATGFLPDGSRWELSRELERVREHWGIYQRSEWLSMAIQGLFWSTLDHLTSQGGQFGTPLDFAEACVEVTRPELGIDLYTPLEEAAQAVVETLVDDDQWHAGPHEHGLAGSLSKATTPRVVAADSIRLLLAVVARSPLDRPFRGLQISPRQLELYPVHLQSLAGRAATWEGRPLRDIVAEVAMDWGLRLHDRVAFRKLRQQLNDTFQVRPEDDGSYRVHGRPVPTFGNPRFTQAVRVLEDLGAIDRTSGHPTAFGLELLERTDG